MSRCSCASRAAGGDCQHTVDLCPVCGEELCYCLASEREAARELADPANFCSRCGDWHEACGCAD